MNVWIVGQNSPELEHRWELCGIYTDRQKAVEACLDESYFIAPVPLDTPAPEEPTVFPGIEFPKGGDR